MPIFRDLIQSHPETLPLAEHLLSPHELFSLGTPSESLEESKSKEVVLSAGLRELALECPDWTSMRDTGARFLTLLHVVKMYTWRQVFFSEFVVCVVFEVKRVLGRCRAEVFKEEDHECLEEIQVWFCFME